MLFVWQKSYVVLQRRGENARFGVESTTAITTPIVDAIEENRFY